jgi:putative nucleotidyltransferase with HDIG domain
MKNNTTIVAENSSTAAAPLILIVDDESAILTALRSLFHRTPYTVQLFSNGSLALDFLVQHTPDIIISDMRMPEMNGLAFLERASSLCPTSTRLMLSGYEDKKIILDALSKNIAHQYIMKPWEDQEMLKLVTQTLQLRSDIRRQHLDDLLRYIVSLPSPPQSHEQLQRVIRKKDRSVKELSAELEKDPSLVTRILRIANSVYFASRMPITNLVDAITFIGTEYVEGLVLALDVFNKLGNNVNPEYVHWLEDVWRHSLHRAFLGRTIAEQWKGRQQPQLAYIVCLLLDIGYVIRLSTSLEQFKQMQQIATSLHIPMEEAEHKVFEIDHVEVGCTLLRLWNFPDDIIEAIRLHHRNTDNNTLVQIAQIANAIESGDPSQPHDPALNPLIQQWQTQLYPNTTNDSTNA